MFRSVLFSFAYCTLLTNYYPSCLLTSSYLRTLLTFTLPLTLTYGLPPLPSSDSSHLQRTQITYLLTCLRGRHGRTERIVYTLNNVHVEVIVTKTKR